jgi:hypothetical protein
MLVSPLALVHMDGSVSHPHCGWHSVPSAERRLSSWSCHCALTCSSVTCVPNAGAGCVVHIHTPLASSHAVVCTADKSTTLTVTAAGSKGVEYTTSSVVVDIIAQHLCPTSSCQSTTSTAAGSFSTGTTTGPTQTATEWWGQNTDSQSSTSSTANSSSGSLLQPLFDLLGSNSNSNFGTSASSASLEAGSSNLQGSDMTEQPISITSSNVAKATSAAGAPSRSAGLYALLVTVALAAVVL